jgi:hypothetical protein
VVQPNGSLGYEEIYLTNIPSIYPIFRRHTAPLWA